MNITPGILDCRLPLLPLDMVSPSQYQRLKTCALQGVWSSTHQPGFLPISPAARLGSVTHRLLEEAGSGRLEPDTDTEDVRALISHRWEELVVETEKEIASSWLEQHLAPLWSSVSNFEVRQRLASVKAAQILHTTRHGTKERRPNAYLTGSELWVEKKDRSVGGRIDRVEVTAEGPVIQDYKSGRITEETMGGVTGTPKAEYVTQLQLYAALYAETVDRWPASLELLPLDGPPIRIAFDPQTCLELLQDAVDLRARVNGVVAASQSAPGVAEMRLANPSPSNCNFCTYRPVCVAYCHARQTAPAHVEWPNDLWGTIEEMKALGNSLLSITLKCDAVDTSDVRVVGLNPSLARHPALSNLKQKDKVALFNLKQIGGASTYSEGRLTVIYKIEWITDSSTCG